MADAPSTSSTSDVGVVPPSSSTQPSPAAAGAPAQSNAPSNKAPAMPSVEKCIAWWKAFDLETKRKQLEEQSVELGNRQDASADARRVLGEEIKSFRKLPEEDKGGAINTLLKLFQDEVDALTRRARGAEKVYVQLVKDLFDAPDPAPPLSLALENVRSLNRANEEVVRLQGELAETRASGAGAAADTRAETDALRKEVAALEEELGKLSNQDITIRELEGRIEEFEATAEQQVGARLAAREAELRRILEGELDAVREAETAAEGRVAALSAAMAEAAAARDEAQTALYSVRARFDDELAGRQAEVDAVVAEAARLREALASTSAQLDEARRHAAAAAEGGAAGSGSSSSSAGSGFSSSSSSSSAAGGDVHASLRAQIDVYRARADAADDECARLSAALTAAQEEGKRWGEVLEARRRANEDATAELHSRIAARDGDIAGLRKELAARPTVNDVAHLRHQLSILQEMHFSSGTGSGEGNEDMGVEAGGSSSSGSGIAFGSSASASSSSDASLSPNSSSLLDASASGTGEVVEVTTLMLRRIRQLETRAVKAETARSEAQGEVERLRAELEEAHEALAEQRESLARLEEVIGNGNGNGNGNGMAGVASAAAAAAAANSSSSNASSGMSSGGGANGSGVTSFSAPTQLDAILSRGGASSLGSGVAAGGGGMASASASSSSGNNLASSFAANSPRRESVALDMSTVFSPGGGGGGGEGGSGDGAMSGVLRAQRDRLRVRVMELETELQARVAELGEAHGRVSKLTGDNVKMYEKIRFLQSFLQAAAAGEGVAAAGGGGVGGAGASAGSSTAETRIAVSSPGGVGGPSFTVSRAELRARSSGAPFSVLGEDEVEKDYRKLYSESLDPFEAFARAQRARQYQRLSRSEKFTLTGSKLLIGNKGARTFLLIYALALHLLVAATLWHFRGHAEKYCPGGPEGHHAESNVPMGLEVRG